MTSALMHPNIDPVILQIYGPISIRWYGLAYILGIMLGTYYIEHLDKKYKLINWDSKLRDDFIIYIACGIILGGRLGYILFYDLHHYLRNYYNIFKIWEGGMSFHGGLAGVLIAMLFLCRKYSIVFFNMTDVVACAVPIGLFFGRIANFINSELVGRPTLMPWGVIFPSIDSLPRHPSQLYEAALEGVLLFCILRNAFMRQNKRRYMSGFTSMLFLIFYGAFRFIVEIFREPDRHIGYVSGILTMGQILCIPLIMIGVFLMRRFMIERDIK